MSAWTAGNQDLQEMADLLASGSFASVRWLVDRSFVTRQPAYCRKLRQLFGDNVIRTTRTHAKFVTLRNESFDLAVRTSMNLNANARMENIEISDDAALCDFLDAEFDEYFQNQEAGTFDAELREGSKSSTGVEVGRVTAKRLFA